MRKFNWVTKACGVFLLWATAALALPAQTFTSLHSFDGTDGSNPYAGLVQATDGNQYGTTEYGGANGEGTVFKITPSGALTTLYSFCSQSNCTDGSIPQTVLVQGTDGNFYGATTYGGSDSSCTLFGFTGCGTIFKITPSGTLTTLHSFAMTDGATPNTALVQATNGNFYGTTPYGGDENPSCYPAGYGCGTVFTITPSGTLTTLHSFDLTDGYNPEAVLVQDANGNFYGATYNGGANSAGTVFKITPGGALTTLHNFDGSDGEWPNGLVQAANGNFYGTTQIGGASGDGTVFKITENGTLTTLHSFDGTNGQFPVAWSGALVQATNGNFYGTTENGGTSGDGTVFEITPSGMFTSLFSFDNTDGAIPTAGLVQGTDGSFYGTAHKGGDNGDGTIFSLSVGLRPFVETRPTSGVVGAAVNILGSNLTGATSVTFNGTAAAFTVVSQYLITTTVPTGATSGKVEVIVPRATLSSNVPFRVN
jgi:uncharacterized repeat protein (TIGR03803 family)